MTHRVVIRCADCHAEMNETHSMTAREIKDDWLQLAAGAGFVSGKCDSGCRSTFSDFNLNVHLAIKDEATGQYQTPKEFFS